MPAFEHTFLRFQRDAPKLDDIILADLNYPGGGRSTAGIENAIPVWVLKCDDVSVAGDLRCTELGADRDEIIVERKKAGEVISASVKITFWIGPALAD